VKHCTVDGCIRPYHCKGLCSYHYQRMHRGITSPERWRSSDYDHICSIDDCTKRSHYTKPAVLCPMHYQRAVNPWKPKYWRHHGLMQLPEYYAWSGMKRRCLDPNNPKYPVYGGRGITVCDRWLGIEGFPNFMQDMGSKPSRRHSLDRIDVNGNYEPTNCRWATPHQQAWNKQNSRPQPGIYYDSKYKNKWSARLEVNNVTVFYGRYATEAEAIEKRRQAERQYLKPEDYTV
jgi:hypothetical protein